MSNITGILSALDRGEVSAAEGLLPLVYDELRKLAATRLAHESPGQTLQATALVHEAWLRLVDGTAEPQAWDGRGHFFAAAGEAMRRILVENARRKQRTKHGGDLVKVDLDGAALAAPHPPEELLALDAALTKLEAVDEPTARLVHLRYFAGLTQADAARTLGISRRTADRTWAYAKAWLHRELIDSGQGA